MLFFNYINSFLTFAVKDQRTELQANFNPLFPPKQRPAHFSTFRGIMCLCLSKGQQLNVSPAALLSPLSGKVYTNNGKTPGKYRLSHPERRASASAYLEHYRKRETLVCDCCCWESELVGKCWGGTEQALDVQARVPQDCWRVVHREVECCPRASPAQHGVRIRTDLAPSFLEPDKTGFLPISHQRRGLFCFLWFLNASQS